MVMDLFDGNGESAKRRIGEENRLSP